MSRTGTVLALLAWAACGIALGQEKPPSPPAQELPPIETGIGPQQAQTPAQPAPTGGPPSAPGDAAKEAATRETLAKTVETLGKNITIGTGDEQIKLLLGGAINADFYYNHARPLG